MILTLSHFVVQYNTEGRKVISTALISMEGIKASFESGVADAENTMEKEGVANKKDEVCVWVLCKGCRYSVI